MRCFNTTLASDIGTGCPSVAGMEANGAIALRSDVRGLSISSTGVATFTIAGDVREVFVPGDMPYKPAVEGTMNDRGLQKFNKTVTFFFPENSYLTQQQIVELQNDGYILMLKDNNGQIMVFGLEAGLRFQSSAQDFNSLDTHGGVDVVMAENNANYPMVFTTYALPFTHEYITGLTIGAGNVTPQNVVLGIDTDKTGYVVLPTGSILTTTAGAINTTYAGAAGSIILIIPKDNKDLSIKGSLFIGVLTTNYAENIDFENVEYITGVYSTSLVTLVGGGAAITTANANILFLNAVESGIQSGSIDVSNQSTALSYDDLSVAAKSAIATLLGDQWTIVIDDLPT